MREHPDFADTLCPGNSRSMAFIQDLWREVLEAHPRARHAHITGDEAMSAIRKGHRLCSRCRRHFGNESLGGIMVGYYTELSRWIRQQGRIPMMWNDMIVKHADATERIPNDIIMCDWAYDNADVDSWNVEDMYWNNEKNGDVDAWERLFGPYWAPDRKGAIKPFPYMRYFHEKGNPVLGSPAAARSASVMPYAGTSGRHANIMRFAHAIGQAGELGLLNTFWPIGTPFESAWNTVLMGADYGWHARIEKVDVFNERFGQAVLGTRGNGHRLFSGLDRAICRVAPGEAVVFAKAWPERSLAPLARTCGSISRKMRNADYAPFLKLTSWCARYADVTARLGRLFNLIDAVGMKRNAPGRVDQATSNTVEVKLGDQIIASRARLLGHQGSPSAR